MPESVHAPGSDVFISYASSDVEAAKMLASDLRRWGWSVWMDDRITVGSEFEIDIERELDNARCVVVVWSNASVASRWVRAEAAAADDQGKLVPVRLAPDVTPPIRFRQLSTATIVPGEPIGPDGSDGGLLAAIGRLTGRMPAGIDPTQIGTTSTRSSGSRRISSGTWRITFRSLGAQARYDLDLRPNGTVTGTASWLISRAAIAGRWTYDIAREVLQLELSGGIAAGTEAHQVTVTGWIDDNSANCTFDHRRAKLERLPHPQR